MVSRLDVKIAILDLIKDKYFKDKFTSNIDKIISEYPRDLFIETLKLADIKRLLELRSFLSKIFCDFFNVFNDLSLKIRRGVNACASLAYDIFVLSHCIVDSKISNEIDNIFNVNIRPYDFINNKDVINNKINCIFRSLASLDNSKMNSNNTENLKLTIEQKLDLIVNSLSEVKSSVYDLKTNLNTLNNEHAILKNTLTEKIKEVCSEMINSQSQATKLVSNSNIEHETSKSPQPGHKRPRNESSEKNVSTPKSIVSALKNRNRNISYKRSYIDLDGTSLNKKGILGANDKISFKTGIIPFNVYVGNVSLETDDEEVLSLFKNNGI